ncbi:MAG: hypothetical protein ACRDOK_05820 [Streptosporangiaceae bacterium]
MPTGQRRSPLVTRLRRTATYQDYERDEYRFVRVGPDDVGTVLDTGSAEIVVTGTSVDGSARVRFADNRRLMTELLTRVRMSGEPVVTPIARTQVHFEATIAAAPGRGRPRPPRRTRAPGSRRAAAATTRRRTERGRGD